jgi:hypothetical protein
MTPETEKKSKCTHWWAYPHTVLSGRPGRDEVVVARYCSMCGEVQCATAANWHRVPEGYTDIKEACVEQLEKENEP